MDLQIPLNAKPLVVEDIAAVNRVDSNNSSLNTANQVPNGTLRNANAIMYRSKQLQDEVEKSGSKIRQHEDNIKLLKTQKYHLEIVILDLQVKLCEYAFSDTFETVEGYSSQVGSEEETIEQIIKHVNSAAGIYCQLKCCHDSRLSNLSSYDDIVGVVAFLGKVDDDNLSRLLSEHLGLQTMLAIVCKTYEGIKALEMYDGEGLVNKGSGIHGVGASIGRALEGRFSVICLENLRPYTGAFLSNDPQRKLDIPKPRLPTGDIPAGFLGFAVNMFLVDRLHVSSLTLNGCGLRETLFYNLFSHLQVYRTRAEMLLALPCISDGAISLDGGMIRSTGVFSLGSREDVGVRFPTYSISIKLPDKYYELEKEVKQKKWEKQRLLEDSKREQAMLDQEKYNFSLKKQEFLKFLADGSNFMAQR